jgi:hypothetical protein
MDDVGQETSEKPEMMPLSFSSKFKASAKKESYLYLCSVSQPPAFNTTK